MENKIQTMKIKISKKFEFGVLFFILNIVLFHFSVFSEGTKQTTPYNAITSQTVLLQINRPASGGSASKFAGWTATSQNDRLFIQIKDYSTEKIYLGFRKNTTSQDVRYQIKRPDGAVVYTGIIPTIGAGYISTWEQANIGPNSLIGNTGGYTPSVFEPNANSNSRVNGDFYIEFNVGTTANTTEINLLYYDITVANGSSNSSVIEGRLWSYNWGFNTQSFTSGGYYGSIYSYTNDQIVTEIDLNGLKPFMFRIFNNEWGTRNDLSLTENRKSNIGELGTPQYKLFLNNPDESVYPSNSDASREATFNNLTGCGDNFCFNISFDGNAVTELRLDLNNNGNYFDPIDKVIEQSVTEGVNCIMWDGKDGLGNNVASNFPFAIHLQSKVGVTHLPIYDAENHPNGYLARLVRPIGIGEMTLYYDNTLLASVGCWPDGTSNLSGVNPSNPVGGNSVLINGVNKWDCSSTPYFGDNRTINTWWVVRKPVIVNQIVTKPFCADLEVSKTDNNSTYSSGSTISYIVTVKNNGPDSSLGAVIQDNAPLGTTITNWTAAFSGGATGAASGMGNISQQVNFPIHAKVIYTVNVSVPATYVGEIKNIAKVIPSSTYHDNVMGNNTAEDVNVPNTDLQVINVVNNNTPFIGTQVVFTITALNNGPSNATEVVVNDFLSDGLNIVSGTSSVGTWNGTTWEIGNLNKNANATLAIVANVMANGNYQNTAIISGEETDLHQENNISIVTLVPVLHTISCPSDIIVTADSGQCSRSGVNLGAPILNNNINDGTFSNDAPTEFPIGTTTVTWTYIDNIGNTYQCVQLVVVLDSELPSITCPEVITKSLEFNLLTVEDMNLGTPITNDNCSVFSVTNNAPNTFQVGTTSVLWTVVDASGNSASCEQQVNVINSSTSIDLGVTKMLTSPDILVNDTIYQGDTVTFTMLLTNYSDTYTSYDIVLLDKLTTEFSYVSSTTSIGSYDPITGFWSISSLNPLSTATLTISAKVDTTAVNDVYILSQSGTDPNFFNNFSFASVTVTSTSSGNEGGIESNGNMASKLAIRNFVRHKESKNNYENAYLLEPFTSETQSFSLKTTKSIDLVKFIPEIGPLGSEPYITSPTDLLGITNATEIISVDYFLESESRKAAVLGMTTNSGTVYNHTKLVCDRLNGGSLENVRYVMIKGKPFIITQLIQDNGDVDWSISFIAYKNGNVYTIDNQWDLESYNPESDEDVLNYQVWSKSEVYTKYLVSTMIEKIESEGYELSFVNETFPIIPSVYVKSGYYHDGYLNLEIVNTNQSSSISVGGDIAYVEDGFRTPIAYTTDISEAIVSQIQIPTNGYIFDIGFNIEVEGSAGRDVLYFADGPWGVDYETEGANIDYFTVLPQVESPIMGTYTLGRTGHVEGSVYSYASLFRVLRVGNKPMNVGAYNMLEFVAFGTGVVDVVVSKKSITTWSQHYKTTITLNNDIPTLYQIPFSQLKNHLGNNDFDASDVVSIVFTKKGDYSTYQNFTIHVDQLRFINGAVNVEETTTTDDLSMNVFPNPISVSALLSFNLPTASKVKVGMYTVDGRLVKNIEEGAYQAGEHSISIDASDISRGVYFIKIQTDYATVNERVILTK